MESGRTLWIDYNRSTARTPPTESVVVLLNSSQQVVGYRPSCPTELEDPHP